MAILTAAGVCKKRGENDKGPWYVIAETITPASGESFDKRYMCSGYGAAPQEGDYGVVTGHMREGVREYNGKWYADIKINGAAWTPITEAQHDSAAAPSGSEPEDIPFAFPPSIHAVTRSEGHSHHRERRAASL